MAEERERTAEKSEKTASKVLYLLLGLGFGSLISILLAPQSGDETRGYVSQKARDANDYSQRKAQEAKERARTLVEGKEAIMEKKAGKIKG